MSDYLNSLSKSQREAVENYLGPSLVIAGAGSGKTRVLTFRIAHMITEGVEPSSILALTFTKKAAGEMKERISKVVSYDRARSIYMGTFHAVFSRILRAEAESIGFQPSFTIYETSDSRNVVKSIIKDLQLDENRYKPKDIFARISKSKNSLITPAMYRDSTSLATEDRERGWTRFSEVYSAYMLRCRQNGAMDFDDLLLYTNILFKGHPDILEKYQDKFKYVLVDEYQDTNSAQYLIIKMLSAKNRNVCVVGDDAQSIYSFRGAKIENILRFQKDYKEAQLYKLEENYRSTQNIVNAANSVIKKNSNQIDKDVFSNRGIGEKIALCRTETDKDEARTVVRDIMSSHDKGVEFKDMAILYRTNAQSRSLEDALRFRAIPYKIYGGMSFYQRAEVKHVIAYMRLMVNKNDDEALKRIVNFPLRGIGATTISKVEAIARQKEINMWQALETNSAQELGLKDAPVRKLKAFMGLISELSDIAENSDAYETVMALIQKSGIASTYQNNPAPESQSAYQNVEELSNAVKQQADTYLKDNEERLTSAQWLEDITLLSDMDRDNEDNDHVTLMTIHSAKGLEYGNVYLVGVEEGLFPSMQCIDNPQEMEEERRLFYVAITRAVNKLMISFAMNRFKWGSVQATRPSPLLRDVDSQYFDNADALNICGNSLLSDEKPKNQWASAGEKNGYGTYSKNERFKNNENPYKKKPMTSTYSSDPTNLRKIETPTSSESITSYDRIKVGRRVRHKRFGVGTVESMEKTEKDIKALIDFGNKGRKNVLLSIAKLEIM